MCRLALPMGAEVEEGLHGTWARRRAQRHACHPDEPDEYDEGRSRMHCTTILQINYLQGNLVCTSRQFGTVVEVKHAEIKV
jgi:hypothetical protein